jgi:hypothetical protein
MSSTPTDQMLAYVLVAQAALDDHDVESVAQDSKTASKGSLRPFGQDTPETVTRKYCLQNEV